MAGVIIVGNGGHARACLDAWPADADLEPLGYVGPEPGDVLGLTYLGDDDALPLLRRQGHTRAFVALGSARARAAVSRRCVEAGLELVTVVAPTAHVGRTARLGSGSVALHGAIVGANARTGPGCIINTGASIDHDCVLGEYVHVAPGAHLAGTVTVGDRSMLGVGASVIPGIVIGADVMVGAGAVVVRDIPDGQTVVGVPARKFEQ